MHLNLVIVFLCAALVALPFGARLLWRRFPNVWARTILVVATIALLGGIVDGIRRSGGLISYGSIPSTPPTVPPAPRRIHVPGGDHHSDELDPSRLSPRGREVYEGQ